MRKLARFRPPMSAEPSTPAAALRSLAFGNVVIGTGALAFVGMLDTVARDLAETPSAIGFVVGAFSLGICIAGPPLGAWTSGLDRRRVLTLSLVLFGVGHFASALAPGYASLLAVRVLTAIAGAIFTPQAAGTASLLVPPERRARTIAFVFIGWSIAAVLGMPVGALVGATVGWRAAMVGIGLLSLVGAAYVWWRIPVGLFVGRIDRAAWTAVATHPVLLMVVSVTAIHASAQFALFSYITIAYRDTLSPSPWLLTLLLSINGLAGVAGNLVAGRVADRIGPPPVIVASLLSMVAAFVLWVVAFRTGPELFAVTLALSIVASVLWGAGNFSANSMQQVRLVDLAPALSAVSVALNSSAIFLGQFIGAAVGGVALAHPVSTPPAEALPWVGLPVFVLAIAVSIAAQRRCERLLAASPA